MKRERLAVVLALVLATSSGLAAVAATGGVAAADGGRAKVTLTVTVTDSVGNALADAEVTAFWDGGSESARTRANGQTLIDVPEGADVRLFVNRSGYTLNNPVLVEDAETQEVDVVVSQNAEAKIVVVSDGARIEGASVVMTKRGENRSAASGTTGSNGAFASGTIEKGTYVVSVVKAGYEQNATVVEVADTTTARVALESATATVTFSVTDDHFDPAQPVEGAQIRIEGPTSATLETGGSGSATLGLPVNARFTVTVSKEGYRSATKTLRLGETDRSLAFTISRKPALTVEAVNERVVVGEKVQVSVTDEYDDPVANATVLVDGTKVGETNAEGVFRAPIDTEGEHTITVRKEGTSASVTVEGVPVGGDTTPTETPTPTATATEEPAGDVPLGDLTQPTLLMKVGVAAVGVLLAFLVVRRLL